MLSDLLFLLWSKRITKYYVSLVPNMVLIFFPLMSGATLCRTRRDCRGGAVTILEVMIITMKQKKSAYLCHGEVLTCFASTLFDMLGLKTGFVASLIRQI